MIRLTADGKGLVGALRGRAEKVNPRGEAAQRWHDSANAAARCFAPLNRQVEAFYKLTAQTFAYEATQHPLTAARNIGAITSQEQQELSSKR